VLKGINVIKEQEVLGRTNRLLSFIPQGPHWKRRVQQFFYCCVRIRYRSNVSTEPVPINDKGIFTKPLPSNDRGHTHTQTAAWSHKPTLFFQNRKVGQNVRTREKNNGKNLEKGKVLVPGKLTSPCTYLAVCSHGASLLGSPGSRSLCAHRWLGSGPYTPSQPRGGRPLSPEYRNVWVRSSSVFWT
jgi:hypothetical protein